MTPCPRCRRHVLPGGTCPFCGQGLSNVDQVCAGDRCYSAEPMTNLVYGPPPVPRPTDPAAIPVARPPVQPPSPPGSSFSKDLAYAAKYIGVSTSTLVAVGATAVVVVLAGAGMTIWTLAHKDD